MTSEFPQNPAEESLSNPTPPVSDSSSEEKIAADLELSETPEIETEAVLDQPDQSEAILTPVLEEDWEQTFDEPGDALGPEPIVPLTAALGAFSIEELAAQKLALQQEVETLQAEKAQWYAQQLQQVQTNVQQLVQEGTRELEQRKAALVKEIDKLERRQDRIQQEMRTTFAGASQELAIRVQGFKEYLVGSLQDLVSAADQLELGVGDSWESSATHGDPIVENADAAPQIAFADQGMASQKRQIQDLLDQYRSRPDYYGPPWQLRRTFEPIHGQRVADWFFNLGGRGAIKSLDSRLQNILVGSAIIAILNQLYGDRSRALILAATPERLGEWRRGLQDCLGISRSDFGPDRGIVLFESPQALVQRAERLRDDRQMPLILIDETEEQIDLALLQFPLLLAFAPNYSQGSGSSSYYPGF
ncbi:MAG: hypothetical protein RLZZ490_1520 [Cyanobacteriota bacterium]|jgi:uncharacterized small protein (DUF1192 family)